MKSPLTLFAFDETNFEIYSSDKITRINTYVTLECIIKNVKLEEGQKQRAIDLLCCFINDPDDDVRNTVLSIMEIDEQYDSIISALSVDPSNKVRFTIVSHVDTPVSILNQLAKYDHSERVKLAAQRRLEQLTSGSDLQLTMIAGTRCFLY